MLVDMSNFWDILTEFPKKDIAKHAVNTILNMSYLHVTSQLKKKDQNIYIVVMIQKTMQQTHHQWCCQSKLCMCARLSSLNCTDSTISAVLSTAPRKKTLVRPFA